MEIDAPDYRLVAAWSAFLLVIGAVAFALGMATGEELPAFEPCRDRKDQMDI
jgi:hypothetical protein